MIHVVKVILLVFLVILVLSNSSNPPNGKTGAPGDGLCSECHNGNHITGEIQLIGLPAEVEPGNIYSLDLQISSSDLVAQKAGFQIVSLYDSTLLRAGDFTVLSGDASTNTVMGREYLEHRGAKPLEDSVATWRFEWMAPVEEGTMTMYIAANIANGNANSSGDGIILSTVSSEIKATTSVVEPTVNIAVYPTMFDQEVFIDLPDEVGTGKMILVGIDGAIVYQSTLYNGTNWIQLDSQVPIGIYIMTILCKDTLTTIKLKKM